MKSVPQIGPQQAVDMRPLCWHWEILMLNKHHVSVYNDVSERNTYTTSIIGYLKLRTAGTLSSQSKQFN